MRIFSYELKKLWNWRILALIVAMGALTWFAFLSESLRSYDSLTNHGIYGFYQKEMFELYGDTLEPEELADYDITSKKNILISEINEIISNEIVFTENNIYNYAQYKEFVENSYSNDLSKEEQKKINDIIFIMQSKLDGGNRTQNLDEWYASPLVRIQTLEALERKYINYEAVLRSFIDNNSSPVLDRTAEKLLEIRNSNLIRYDLQMNFSLYATVVGVFTLIAVIIFVAPLLTVDRMRKLNLMQYSSTIGRRIFRIQFIATIVSALVLSIILIALAYIPFIASGAWDYWDAHMMSLDGWGIQLYNITFGQYVFILAGMTLALSVGTACFAFILSSFSANIMMMLIKAVSVGIAIVGISVISINKAFMDTNIIFSTIFQGRIDAPEIMVCSFIAVIGLILAVIIYMREKRVDVM